MTQVSDYFTKYSMTDTYRDHDVHGLYADGTQTPSNVTLGAWMIYNTKDTFYGGPTYSDLTVDGLLYNIMMSNHHGNTCPNITSGFDRTWGPSIYYFNKGAAGQSVSTGLNALRKDAAQYATTTYNAQFYDDIASYVSGYVPTSGRGNWSTTIKLPTGASNTIAILSAPGYDFQDNAYDTKAYQYWANVSSTGAVEIDRVKAGTYRLTCYASGIFGDFVYAKNITITAGKKTTTPTITWTAESAGTELWRIGTPDKSAGEFKHGYARDTTRSDNIPEYRLYWGAHDFVSDFPNGVSYTIGTSTPANDFNYVHWSVFGGSYTRPSLVSTTAVSNWTVNFDLTAAQIQSMTTATLTIQFAAVSGESGNEDVGTRKYSSLPYNVAINGYQLDTFKAPYWHSSSCAIRSGIICFGVRNKWTFPVSKLSSSATNKLVLSMPNNPTEGGVTISSLSVMYDALRLEVA